MTDHRAEAERILAGVRDTDGDGQPYYSRLRTEDLAAAVAHAALALADAVERAGAALADTITKANQKPGIRIVQGGDPYGRHRGHCRSCPAEIIWAETTSGKAIPVDAAPVSAERGNIRLRARDGRAPLALIVPEEHRDADDEMHLSHFVTCPNAEQHRRRSGQ